MAEELFWKYIIKEKRPPFVAWVPLLKPNPDMNLYTQWGKILIINFLKMLQWSCHLSFVRGPSIATPLLCDSGLELRIKWHPPLKAFLLPVTAGNSLPSTNQHLFLRLHNDWTGIEGVRLDLTFRILKLWVIRMNTLSDPFIFHMGCVSGPPLSPPRLNGRGWAHMWSQTSSFPDSYPVCFTRLSFKNMLFQQSAVTSRNYSLSTHLVPPTGHYLLYSPHQPAGRYHPLQFVLRPCHSEETGSLLGLIPKPCSWHRRTHPP